ncbi:T-cell-interacting, activating receptor on myeloid cells protein 1-like [Lepidochelys kempii]|uniref:T-cell-interacting, activating receptor on myeloid cells protein 1-like n=1 Tax=Lepidochelys kempii TaxID=8472 RepID=UPI003C6F75A0
MASALMNFFLGCWLAGQSGVSGQSGESGQLPAPRPSISASPSGVIALGGAVTIRCQCQCESRRLFLYKGRFQIQELDADGDEGEFTIPRAKREDGGAYSCRSRSRSEPPNWSYRSNIVWIIVAELSYPKPSISLQPSGGVVLGGAVTIQCWGPLQNVRFLLYKEGSLNALQNAELPGVEFLIRSVSRRDAGSYSCSYHHKSDLSMWSQPSDPVELVVAGGTDPTKPGVEPAPSRPGSAGPAAPLGRPDFTHANITRLGLGAVVLLVLGLSLAEAYYSRRRGAPSVR